MTSPYKVCVFAVHARRRRSRGQGAVAGHLCEAKPHVLLAFSAAVLPVLATKHVQYRAPLRWVHMFKEDGSQSAAGSAAGASRLEAEWATAVQGLMYLLQSAIAPSPGGPPSSCRAGQ